MPLWQMSATPRSTGGSDDLIGHHRHSIEEIHEAVAVRTEEGQVAGTARRSSRVSRRPASVPVSEKPDAEADEAAGAARRERAGDRRRLVIRHGDERRVGHARQIGDRAIVGGRGGRRAGRMHAPYRAANSRWRHCRRQPHRSRRRRRSARCCAARSVDECPPPASAQRRFNSILRELGAERRARGRGQLEGLELRRTTSAGNGALAGLSP